MRWDVLRNNRAGSNHGATPYGGATNNGRISSNRCAILNNRLNDIPSGTYCPRVQIVREARVRSNEYLVSSSNSAIQRCEILNLAIVPDDNIRVDVHIFANNTSSADPRPFSDLGPVPNERSLSNDRIGGDLGGWMDMSGH